MKTFKYYIFFFFLIALGKFPAPWGECNYLFFLDTPLLAAGSIHFS